mgnify:CR=1 FL=1
MASFDLTRYVTPQQDTVDDAMSLIEAKLELVDSTKNIRAVGVVHLGRRTVQHCIGYVIYDT